ncbi:MAG: hypothetical protein FGM47_03825 [Candidatus Nanopelagicaceae bacterium]|nr:hypothetical protein [Candidatus Nanopelagicaceae bacterium]
MRRLLSVFVAFIFFVLGMPAVHANTLITLSAPTTRLADGRFINNDLAISVSPGGKFGELFVNPGRGVRSWLIDPAFIEEVLDLADGYVYLDAEGKEVTVESFDFAQQWFNLLVLRSRGDQVVALTYGSPSLSYLKKYAPGELGVYNRLSQQRLKTLMGREVSAPGATVLDSKNPALVARNSYTPMRKVIRVVNDLVKTPEVENLRLGIAKTLNPKLEGDAAVAITKSYFNEIQSTQKKIRVSPGNYTITTANYDLPVTVINDFAQEVLVDLDITTTNSRVITGAVPRITVPANSQTQIQVPLEVIASGETVLRLQLLTPEGNLIGEVERIPLRLAVISPITTWFTTGMAIILLLAAVIQSVRRIRRRKQSE